MLIAEGQVCMNERSRFDRDKASVTDLKANYDKIEECAQYCKSISNRFIIGKGYIGGVKVYLGDCYCQTGTREAGRCNLKANAYFDLYEFRYPGKSPSCAVTQMITPGVFGFSSYFEICTI